MFLVHGMSTRHPYVIDPLPWHPGLVGEYPGQTCEKELVPGVAMVFCWCPPTPEGQPFLMGSPPDEAERADDEVQHRVHLTQGFWLAKHPVTQAQWSAIMGTNPSQKGKGDWHPVDSVSWKQAQEFCQSSGLRLPTETEWEYACRAGATTPFGIGTGLSLNAQMANFDGGYPYGTGPHAFDWLYRDQTLSAGSFPPNDWGLHDMHGQLWEWCEDRYGALGVGEATNPAGAAEGRARVLRGGGWISFGRDARSACRFCIEPGTVYDSFGFRPCPSPSSTSAGGVQGVERRAERSEGRAKRSP